MSVSDADRAYMRRLGSYKAASHAEAAAMHRARPMTERLLGSWQLSVTHRAVATLLVRDDDPGRFYDLARALGLYRP